METPNNKTLTTENVQQCLEYLATLEGTKLGLGIRWQIPLRQLLATLESGNVTPKDEETFAQILREMEQEGGLLEFRNRLAEAQMGPGFAEVHELQQKLPQMTVEEIRRRLADVTRKYHQAASDMNAAIEAAANSLLAGKPIESLDTVAALRFAHLELLGQFLSSALRAKNGNKPPEA